MGGRYYSPVMKSFISACNFDEILYNISVPGSLNAYAIGNPMYFPMNGYNINSYLLNGGSVKQRSNGINLPKIPWIIDKFTNLMGTYTSTIQGIEASRYVFRNMSFFDDMIMQGISLNKAMTSLPNPKWALGAFEKAWIGLEAMLDYYDSRQRGVSIGGSFVGAGLTAVKGYGMLAASKGIMYSATAIGTFILPGIGTAVGFIVGVAGTIVFNIYVGGWLDGQIDKFIDWLF